MSSKGRTTATKEEATPALVPKLRFPEFREAEGWKPVTLQEASVPVTERVGRRELTPVSISAGIGFVRQSEKFGRDISGNQYQLYTLVRDGDFVFNKGNSLQFPQGCVYLLQGWGQVAAPNVFICFRLNDGYSNSFFQNCFEQNQHGKQLKRHITSGARSNGLLNISKGTFFGVAIPTPRPAEQQKIAECLSSVAEVITAQARKLDALKTHKKGLMQQLFPREGETLPRLRFPEFQDKGEWVVRRLGDFADVSASGDLDAATFSPEHSEKHCFPVYSNAVERAGLYGFSSVARHPVNSVTITARGTLGRAFLRTTDFVGIGRLLVVSNFTGKVDPNFLKACWDHLAVIPQEVTSIPQFTAVAARVTALPFPSLPEQQRIATCLSTLDDLIAAETHKYEALKTHKRGLMQQLFPSPAEVTL